MKIKEVLYKLTVKLIAGIIFLTILPVTLYHKFKGYPDRRTWLGDRK